MTTTNLAHWGTVLGSKEGFMCYLGCVDETPNFPHFDLAQGPHTFLYGPLVDMGFGIGIGMIPRVISFQAWTGDD